MTQAMENEFRIVFSTFPNMEAAKTLANQLLAKKWVACVNILPKLTSIYRWKGEIVEEQEILCIFKTSSMRVGDVISYIGEHHPYDCPEAISFTIEEGLPGYLEWLDKNT